VSATALQPAPAAAPRLPPPAAHLAAVLGHELRNPLASALATVGLLGEMIDATDPRRAVLDGAVADLERMAGLLDAYLAFARTRRPGRQPVPLRPLLAAVAARGRGRATRSAEGDLVVDGDATLLARALENLVENALQAGAASVRLGAAATDDGVVIAVEDDGPGVPAALRERVFEPGFSRGGGTGLGLGIVAETVAGHGGSVRCDAAPRGARFVIELPARRASR
jgi:signal transduction histidine kinase